MGRDRPVKQFMLKPRCDKTQYLYFKSYSKSSLILLTWFSASSSWASSSLWKLPKEKGNESSNDIFDRFNFVTIFFTIIVEIVVALVSNLKNHLKQLHMKFSREHLDIAFNIWYKITLFTSQVLVTYWLFCLKVFTTTVTFIHGYSVYW